MRGIIYCIKEKDKGYDSPIYIGSTKDFNMRKSENHVLPMIRQAKVDYPEYREILGEFEHGITEKLNDLKAYLAMVRTRGDLIDILSEIDTTKAESVALTDSERREA